MILTDYGLRFRREGELWSCVERADLAMPRGELCRVGERIFGSLDDALRHARGDWLVHAAGG